MARALVNARIHVMDDPDHVETALLEEEGRIILVGDDDAVRAAAEAHGITPEDLGGRVVLPGFVDAHMHFLHVGVKRTRPDLSGARSKQEALDRVRAWLDAHPGTGPVTAEGWDEADWGGDAPPTRSELDAVEPQRPLVLRRVCGHKAVANAPALAVVRQRWDDPEKVDPDAGVLLEEPSLFLNEVLPEDPDVLDQALQVACSEAHRLGVTTLGDFEQAPLRDALVRGARSGSLSVRVNCSIYPQQLDAAETEGFRTGRAPAEDEGDGDACGVLLRDGGMKVFLDGSIGGHTALLLEPYTDRPETRGARIWTDEQLDGLFGRAHAAGIQLMVHAIGDGAVEQGLQAFERLAAHVGEDQLRRLRHRFEHYELVHDDQIRRTAALGLTPCSQPNFVGAWSAKGGLYEERLGDRFRANNRFQRFKQAGLRVAFGSDGMPFGPLVGLQAAVDHPEEPERMTAAEAIWHYTHEAAWSLHREDEVGTLEPGRCADWVVLDETGLDGRPADWRIRETVVGGRTLYAP